MYDFYVASGTRDLHSRHESELPVVCQTCDLNPGPQDQHDSTFHVPETPVLITQPSGILHKPNDEAEKHTQMKQNKHVKYSTR